MARRQGMNGGGRKINSRLHHIFLPLCILWECGGIKAVYKLILLAIQGICFYYADPPGRYALSCSFFFYYKQIMNHGGKGKKEDEEEIAFFTMPIKMSKFLLISRYCNQPLYCSRALRLKMATEGMNTVITTCNGTRTRSARDCGNLITYLRGEIHNFRIINSTQDLKDTLDQKLFGRNGPLLPNIANLSGVKSKSSRNLASWTRISNPSESIQLDNCFTSRISFHYVDASFIAEGRRRQLAWFHHGEGVTTIKS